MNMISVNKLLTKHETVILKVAIIIVFILSMLVAYTWYYMFTLNTKLEQAKDTFVKQTEGQNGLLEIPQNVELSYEEKMQVLNSLEKNPNNFSAEDKRAILENMKNTVNEPIIP